MGPLTFFAGVVPAVSASSASLDACTSDADAFFPATASFFAAAFVALAFAFGFAVTTVASASMLVLPTSSSLSGSIDTSVVAAEAALPLFLPMRNSTFSGSSTESLFVPFLPFLATLLTFSAFPCTLVSADGVSKSLHATSFESSPLSLAAFSPSAPVSLVLGVVSFSSVRISSTSNRPAFPFGVAEGRGAATAFVLTA